MTYPAKEQMDQPNKSVAGPLTVHPANPRYFADPTGRPVYLTGSHTWTVVQDANPENPPTGLDWEEFLQSVRGYGHNFIRLWTWEQARWAPWYTGDFHFTPNPWARTGPGDALDGGLRFDLSQLNSEWLDRLRNRIESAGVAGMYVSVMLFQGWAAGPKPKNPDGGNPWLANPFNPANNVNRVDGSGGSEGGFDAVHTLRSREVVAFQEQYVMKVIDAVNQYAHVLYEVGNEFDGSAENTAWQYHIVDFVHAYERDTQMLQHPVIMTSQYPDPRNEDLFASPADAVAPFAWRASKDECWEYDPPARYMGKVVFLDTDHLWGVGGTVDWVWRCFMRGYNPLYMDPWGFEAMEPRIPAGDEEVRRAMGQARRLSVDIDLSVMVPRPEICNTGFALYDDKETAVVYQPYGDRMCVDLGRDLSGASVEWRHPVGASRVVGGKLQLRGRTGMLTPPWPGSGIAIIRLPGT
jgi:hypothetical protein